MTTYIRKVEIIIHKYKNIVCNLILIGVISYIMSIGSLYFSTGVFVNNLCSNEPPVRQA